MEQFAVAGTDYLRLNCFATGQGDRGAVARSLAEFLNCFMHCYTAAIVSTQGTKPTPSCMMVTLCMHSLLVCVSSLIQLSTVLHKQMMIIRCAICNVLCSLLSVSLPSTVHHVL